MRMLIEYFTAALRFFRPAAKTPEPTPGTQNWLTAPAGPLSWEEALSGTDKRQQADPTIR
jgi:hypothetical protein